jgi:hypothetical protein
MYWNFVPIDGVIKNQLSIYSFYMSSNIPFILYTRVKYFLWQEFLLLHHVDTICSCKPKFSVQ